MNGFLEALAGPEEKPNLGAMIRKAKGNAISRENFLTLQEQEQQLRQRYDAKEIDSHEYQSGLAAE